MFSYKIPVFYLLRSNSYGIYSFYFVGDNIYAGTSNGLYFEFEKGKKWTHLGLEDESVKAITICNGRIFAGTWNGVYVSVNNGKNWVSSNTGIPKNFESLNISIYNIKGQLQLEQNLVNDKSKMNIKGLPPGIYILKLKDKQKTEAIKFVKE